MKEYLLGHKPCRGDNKCEGYTVWWVIEENNNHFRGNLDDTCNDCDRDLCLCDAAQGFFCDSCKLWFTDFPVEIRFQLPEFDLVRANWPTSW